MAETRPSGVRPHCCFRAEAVDIALTCGEPATSSVCRLGRPASYRRFRPSCAVARVVHRLLRPVDNCVLFEMLIACRPQQSTDPRTSQILSSPIHGPTGLPSHRVTDTPRHRGTEAPTRRCITAASLLADVAGPIEAAAERLPRLHVVRNRRGQERLLCSFEVTSFHVDVRDHAFGFAHT